MSFVHGLEKAHHTGITSLGGTDSLWKLDACEKARDLVDLVRLMTTLNLITVWMCVV